MSEPTSESSVPVDVVVAVQRGRRPEPLIEAIGRHHPGWNCYSVWAGDPQLRPGSCGDHTWFPSPVDEGDLLRAEPDGVPWLVALRAVQALGSERPVIVLRAGVAVLGVIDALVPADGELVVVPRVLGPPSADGHPTADVLGAEGSQSDAVASFGAGTAASTSWLLEQLVAESDRGVPLPVGRLLELAAQYFRSRSCADDRIGASVWRWPDRRPHLLDLLRRDPERPWLADPTIEGTPRVSLADPDRLAVLAEADDQLAGGDEPLRLPGGILVDPGVRRIARRTPDLPAPPWTQASAFRRWLHDEYWNDLHRDRADLQHAFPHPSGIDADRFAVWARRATVDGLAPLMIEPGVLRESARIRRTGERRDGVNLVGYFKHQSGVANVGRRVAAMLDRQGVPHSVVAYERTDNPAVVPEPATDQRLEFADSLAFVNGDQFHHLHDDVPEIFGAGRQVVGLWCWELETIDGAPPVGHAHVDQIWAMTTFMTRPFRDLGVPVHHVHVPFDEPVSSGRPRSSFGPLAEADGRFVFGVVLDHLSVTERKNPIAAIRAFRRAFPYPDPAGPLLVVKTINAATCWREHERLLVEAMGRDDIVVWDELLPIADHMALIESFDALVSLHRSEGIGLHIAEAMWLDTPVIATNYSGNVDFTDHRSALLIDADMVRVGPGRYPYPPDARWAEPHLDEAADALRQMASDPDLTAKLARAGREKMESMPGEREFVDRMVALLNLERASSD